MAVYVDPPMPRGGKFNNYCHMMADSVDELHQFAAELELRPEWFQDKPDHPHYDISLSKRQKAVRLGAVEVDSKFMVKLMYKYRAAIVTPRVENGNPDCPQCSTNHYVKIGRNPDGTIKCHCFKCGHEGSLTNEQYYPDLFPNYQPES